MKNIKNMNKMRLAMFVLFACCSPGLHAADDTDTTKSPTPQEDIFGDSPSGINSRPQNGLRPCRSAMGGSGPWSMEGLSRSDLQLNEDTLWSGGPHDYDNPDAYSAPCHGSRTAWSKGRVSRCRGRSTEDAGLAHRADGLSAVGRSVPRFPARARNRANTVANWICGLP